MNQIPGLHPYDQFNNRHFKSYSFTVAAPHVCLASFVAKQASNNQVGTVQVVGSAYEGLGLISQLTSACLDTAILPTQVAVSAQIQRQEVFVSQGFSAPTGHESQHHAHEVRKIYTN